jgi:hypothetical protein
MEGLLGHLRFLDIEGQEGGRARLICHRPRTMSNRYLDRTKWCWRSGVLAVWCAWGTVARQRFGLVTSP